MASYLRPRRGKKSTAESQNIVLKRGEVFFECPDTGVGTGKGKVKVGDGSTGYASLPYFMENFDLDADTSVIGFTDSSTETAASNNATYLSNIKPASSLKTIFTNLKQLLYNYNAEITKLNNDKSPVGHNHDGRYYMGNDKFYIYADVEGGNWRLYNAAGTKSTEFDMAHSDSWRFVHWDGTNPIGVVECNLTKSINLNQPLSSRNFTKEKAYTIGALNVLDIGDCYPTIESGYVYSGTVCIDSRNPYVVISAFGDGWARLYNVTNVEQRGTLAVAVCGMKFGS